MIGHHSNELDKRAIAMSKALTADAVEHAGHGHPGSAISLAPIVYTLYQRFINHDPNDPHWEGRDRFILSGGHASLSQYTQLYLSGYGLTLDDIKHYRCGSDTRTPGHPEYRLTPGLEMTTGPLGQGLASAVGFAYGQRYQRGLLDPDAPVGRSPFDHHIWVMAGEGDLEEGVSSEASSLAGNERLGNLTVIFDSNRIQIEGDTKITFAEDVLKRYESYGWYTDEFSFIQPDGSYKEDIDGLAEVIEKAEKITDRPKFIKVDTVIAWPTPGKAGDASTHGALLGAKPTADLKALLGLDPDKTFQVDEEALAHAREVAQRGLKAHAQWDARFDAWKSANPQKYALYRRLRSGGLPEGFDQALDDLKQRFKVGDEIATRHCSGHVLNAIAKVMPELWGGSADLGSANMTDLEGADSFAPAQFATKEHPKAGPYGRQIHFGVREFAMGAITNGILLDTDTRPFGGTFFQFADYERPAVRLAALMKLPNLFVWTHDSIALGQDGPTHQPVEHLAAMRAMPDMEVVRPADMFETIEAYRYFFERKQTLPVAMVLSRQPIPNLKETSELAREGVRRGAYVLRDTEGEPDVILMGSGSEVQLALKAAKQLARQGVKARVVSVPSIEWFEEQSPEYRESVLPESVEARVSVEAGIAMPWYRYLGSFGIPVSVERFGLQGEGLQNLKDVGITAEHVADAAKASIEKVAAHHVRLKA
ncbi:transketolase [Bifidobacterium sp. ESL0763]|uniref:transketolase n=1 Tax=Bifidobacterium sp. ESL0763 TaxID=2983227 RepID=UPI0023F6EB81|nr:transketolase [Bifidobacterium sp. ESL0763]MDF7664270.1 transketolase [Bifidobacterium sp. ESL0763]